MGRDEVLESCFVQGFVHGAAESPGPCPYPATDECGRAAIAGWAEGRLALDAARERFRATLWRTESHD